MPGSLRTLLVCLSSWSTALGQTFQVVPPPLGMPNVPLSTSQFGNGLCIADFDGDGDVDVVVATATGSGYRYFRNDGGMSFTDRSPASGLTGGATALCLVAGDVDNDGDQDLFVGRDGAPAQLFVNDGAGQFTEQAALRGITSSASNYGASFGDFDRDGHIDLYLGNRTITPNGAPSPNVLYRNTGGGFFTDVTTAAGVGNTTMTFVSLFLDFDEDGWPDLLEINDRGVYAGPNELYRNLGNGTFAPVGSAVGANAAISGMGCDFTDVFGDGGVDFFVSDLPVDHLFQLWSPTANAYVDATYAYGLQGGGTGWAVHWLDYDNDGWQDLHVVHEYTPNLLFRNPGTAASPPAPWSNQAFALGASSFFHQFTAAVADLDDDGRLDLVQRYATGFPGTMAPTGIAVFRNAVATGSWLKLRLVGVVGNRDALGARVEVFTGPRRQRQWVRSGTGFLSDSDRRLHFGLGSATQADLVRVTWPSGQVQHLTNVAANQIVDVVEPSISLAAPATVGGVTSLEVSIPGDGGLLCLMAMSFADGPGLPLPGGVVPIGYDGLTAYTLTPGNGILPGSLAILDAAGHASSPLIVPALPALAGVTAYATAVTIDVPTFPFLRTVFPRALPIPIQ